MYEHPSGALYIVSTPIGNLDDITLRALRILLSVDLIAAEDTRVTRILLERHGIDTPVVSYHAHNAEEKAPLLVSRLREGRSIALVTDAGTPLVSDPGTLLVRAAIEGGFPVHPVPGASAVLSALVVSGLESDRFHFEGFLPRRVQDIRERLSELKSLPATLIFYESPRRIRKTLALLSEVLGDRPSAFCRELTKKFETTRRGTLFQFRDTMEDLPERGEWTILVSGAVNAFRTTAHPDGTRIESALSELDIPKSQKARFYARLMGIPRRTAYKTLFPDANILPDEENEP
jgi:16S rRNA (cytidine1402-2'-O)-methyltransferase